MTALKRQTAEDFGGASHVRPKQPCTFDHEGEAVILNPGDIFRVDHELVRERPHLFRPVISTRGEVETMTAGPGEKRR